MKKLCLIAAVALLAFTSCTKKKCWKCSIYQVTPKGIIYDSWQTVVVCDKTFWEIRRYEAENTFNHIDTTDNTGYRQETTCK